MLAQLSPTLAAYVQSVNNHDADAYIALFAEDAVVDDGGRVFRGVEAIKAWSDHDIFEADVTFEVLDAVDGAGEKTITTKVDGNFDRTGLPDPVLIDHQIALQGNKILKLTCRLVESPRPS